MWYPYACFVCDKNCMGSQYAKCRGSNCDHEKGGSPILCPDCWRRFWNLGIIVETKPGVQVDTYIVEGTEYEFNVCPTKGLLAAVTLMDVSKV